MFGLRTFVCVIALVYATGCGGAAYGGDGRVASPPSIGGPAAVPDRPVDDDELLGGASWYGPGFDGRLTASGEPFDMWDLTAAHKSLPFGTIVRVVRIDTRQNVVVRINDRGPFHPERVIDLSRGAAEQIEIVDRGVADVQLEILHWGDGRRYGR